VEKALVLTDHVAEIQKCITNLEGQLTVSDSDLLSINDELQSTKQHLATMKAVLNANLAVLGVEETKELKKLKTSHYLQDRMNARALKYHIHDHLCQRKFEFDRLAHEYCQTINGVFCFCFLPVYLIVW
jgi:uncharacterized protein YceH (UPF0502 family)